MSGLFLVRERTNATHAQDSNVVIFFRVLILIFRRAFSYKILPAPWRPHYQVSFPATRIEILPRLRPYHVFLID